MTPEQLKALEASSQPKSIIASDFKDGTLLYGYTPSRNNFHVYKENGELHVVVHCGNTLLYHEAYTEAEGHEFNPGKRTYVNHTDFDFALALRNKASIDLTFSKTDSDKDINDLMRYKDFTQSHLSQESRNVLTSEFFYLFEELAPSGNEILDAYFKLESIEGKVSYVTDVDGKTLPITEIFTFLLEAPNTKHPELSKCMYWVTYLNTLIVSSLNTLNSNYSRPFDSLVQLPVINTTEKQYEELLEEALSEHKQYFDASLHDKLIDAKNMVLERLSPYIFGKLESIKPKTKQEVQEESI